MYALHEDYARIRAHEVEANAGVESVRRSVRAEHTARRWQRVSAWAAHRSDRAHRVHCDSDGWVSRD